jgi:nitrate reductase beta subunit
MRGHMRKREVLGEHDATLPEAVGMSVEDVEDMYRLLAIAKYDDRYVIPMAHVELADRLMEQQGTCGLDFEGGPGNCGAVPGPIPSPIPDGPPGPDTGGFMLTGEDSGGIDIVQMAADGRRIDRED